MEATSSIPRLATAWVRRSRCSARGSRLAARRNELRLTKSTAVLDGLDGEDVYFAHSFACVPGERVTVAKLNYHAEESVSVGGP